MSSRPRSSRQQEEIPIKVSEIGEYGYCSRAWWYKHVVQHHPAPNVIGVDTDADLLPWFAMTVDEVRAASGLKRFYFEHLQFV